MRKTLKHPITVSLSKEVSKFTNRITFRLRYYDAVNHKRLPELSKKLDFYAYGKSDSEAFYKAKVHREKAQVEINSKGYHPKKLNTTDFIAFFTELTLQKNEGTREVYQHAVQHLKLFLKVDVLPFDKVEELLIESFKRYLLDELAQNTANTYFSAILHGIKKARKYIKDFIEVKRIRQVKSYKSDLSEEQIQVLWNTEMPNHDIKRAFFFGLFSGLRISDIKRLQYKNILFLDGEYILSIQMKKTKTQIYNYLNPIVAELLGDRGKGSDLVFPNLPSSTSAINSALKRWANHAGIKSHVTSHVARVSFATLLLQKSGNIYAVKEALGHSDINCTMNAYAHIKPTQMKQATKLAGISISLKPDASNCA